MIRHLVKLSIIGTIIGVGTIGLGIGAIVAECRRHKVTDDLYWAGVTLAISDFERYVTNEEIKRLKKEIQNLKSNCQETKES